MALLKSERLSPEKECEALINRNSEYRLSGDCGKFFRCAITGKACLGREIRDDDDQSSQFFSRGHAVINKEEIKKCPSYGVTKEELPAIIRRKKEQEAEEIINKL